MEYLFSCASGIKNAQALRDFGVKESYDIAMLVFGKLLVLDVVIVFFVHRRITEVFFVFYM